MRCSEVIRRLNEGLSVSAEMKQHLSECPSCAKQAEAAGVLTSAFETVSVDFKDDSTPIDYIREKTMTELGKEKNTMSKIAHSIRTRPRMAWAAAFAAVLLVVATLVPFQYEKTVGYTAEFGNVDPVKAVPVAVLDEAVDVLGYEAATISMDATDGVVAYRVANLPSKLAVREVKAVLASTVSFSGEPVVKPVREKIAGTIYAQVREKLAEIRVNAAGKTDEQIEAEIEDKLRAHGALSPDVNVSTSADGSREINVSFGGDSSASYMIGVFDAGAPETEKIQIEASEDITDSDLKSLIEQELIDRGAVDAKVTVETDDDSMRTIHIDK